MTSLLELLLLVQKVCAPLRKRLGLCCWHIWHAERPSERQYCRCIIRNFFGFCSLDHPHFVWCLSAVTPSGQATSSLARHTETDYQGQHDAEAVLVLLRRTARVNQQVRSRAYGLYKYQCAASDAHLLLLYNPYHH